MKDLVKKIIPAFLIDWYHFLLPLLGAILYGFPSKKIKVIGVTGTNGKSTVVNLTTRVLQEAGYKVASVSSIRFKIGKKEWPNTLKMTMPGRMKLQKFLRQAVAAGCQYAVLEVASEGIKQHRHRFIDFNTAVLTNLTPEHIEAHGGFKKYRKAKGKLFQAAKGTHIINLDDDNADYFLQFPAKKKIKYQIKGDQVSIDGNPISISLKLLGSFNLYNAAAAISVGLAQGIDLATCQKAVEKAETIPGRMEVVIKEPFKVIVDYAVTPDALEMVYKTIQQIFSPSNLVCVLGACGGGRDKWKRPELGKIAAKYCDKIFLTNEDPYDEDEFQIVSQIESGITSNKKMATEVILDRRRAIRESLRFAKPNDAVIITGKGSEPWLCLKGGKKIPWDEKKVVKEEYEKV